ncbi:NADAR family protein [Cohnella sp. GCM10020058]|uniref:NADAR family protein n=1 Tax=Cohnella sp. GCM10020058 TaxID=3317330 RepID=UPI0036333C3F
MNNKLEQLRRAYNAGEKPKFLFFWGHTPAADGSVSPSCLSQWWMSRFEVDGIAYSCTEQYMMAEKARLFGDADAIRKIMSASQPKEMKALGRAVKHFQSTVWEQNCYEIVKRGNYAKFSQNRRLREFLKSTKDLILVEASPFDRIWGIGLEKDHPDAINPLKWRGSNLLGFALTEVRDNLLEEEGS